jgi:hypothetical protein
MKQVHSFTRRHLPGNVTLAPFETNVGASRMATVFADEHTLRTLFGMPVHPQPEDVDSRVTKIWTFETPRGLANLRDYWWNRSDEWSVAARDRRAARWLRRHVYACLEQMRG